MCSAGSRPEGRSGWSGSGWSSAASDTVVVQVRWTLPSQYVDVVGHRLPKPHFDFHFDMVDMAAIQAVNPADQNYAAKADHAPEAKYVPQDYAIPPGPSAAVQAVPGMGVTWSTPGTPASSPAPSTSRRSS